MQSKVTKNLIEKLKAEEKRLEGIQKVQEYHENVENEREGLRYIREAYLRPWCYGFYAVVSKVNSADYLRLRKDARKLGKLEAKSWFRDTYIMNPPGSNIQPREIEYNENIEDIYYDIFADCKPFKLVPNEKGSDMVSVDRVEPLSPQSIKHALEEGGVRVDTSSYQLQIDLINAHIAENEQLKEYLAEAFLDVPVYDPEDVREVTDTWKMHTKNPNMGTQQPNISSMSVSLTGEFHRDMTGVEYAFTDENTTGFPQVSG